MVQLVCTGRDRHHAVRLWSIRDRRTGPLHAPGGPVGAGIQVLERALPGERGVLGWTIDERGRTTWTVLCPVCSPDGRVGVQFRVERLGDLLDLEYRGLPTDADPFCNITADISWWQ